MDRRAWWATVPGVAKELDMTLKPNNNNKYDIRTEIYLSSLFEGPGYSGKHYASDVVW